MKYGVSSIPILPHFTLSWNSFIDLPSSRYSCYRWMEWTGVKGEENVWRTRETKILMRYCHWTATTSAVHVPCCPHSTTRMKRPTTTSSCPSSAPYATCATSTPWPCRALLIDATVYENSRYDLWCPRWAESTVADFLFPWPVERRRAFEKKQAFTGLIRPHKPLWANFIESFIGFYSHRQADFHVPMTTS